MTFNQFRNACWAGLMILMTIVGVLLLVFGGKDAPTKHINVPDRGKLTVPEMQEAIRRSYPAVEDMYLEHRDALTHNLLLGLFYLESKLDTEAGDKATHYGLGQMGEAAAEDVDRHVYKRRIGITWMKVRGSRAGDQVSATIAYLDLLLYRSKGDIREALRRYGPSDVEYRYADLLLKFEDVLKSRISMEEALRILDEGY